ncbi:MAG: aminoacyl-tRNA hydrolase [Bacteroidaceae bacterium]|nr:aminoacyl-tRNA hydrolase [Bacteroidaceae bacterium]MBQ3538495.1 aminoacyl-tRNA hydrolase [Bacteroidaceae bacterium]MBQ6693440.1 aminoacyl-tRNA hydrolase [Bacteroidaceae bacterium]MBR7166441.1 aminoacyl-tRNA hydrolase [Bacteroidaceae bacterium]
MKYLIVGLGNIGCEYEGTRHNIGFTVLDAFAKASNTVFADRRYGFVAEASCRGRKLILLKPSTYMNLSGNAVRYWMQAEKIPLENVLVIVDDLALPVGALRLKGQGSDGGHNGLKHIATVLGTNNYARLRFGIGNDFGKGQQVDFVLGTFDNDEQKAVDEQIETVCDIIKSFCFAGLARTMNQYNKKGIGK